MENEELKEVRANLHIEVICVCPNCASCLDIFDLDRVKESLGDDHRAADCEIEITCEDCNTPFIITDIDF